ncbi:MAG: MFS transporter, partial [Desulfobacterales bacterium]|nr:MFS transporter [Desulfobacterales bacterium]
YSLIRPDAFIFCFAIDLSVSFLPLYSKELYTPVWGLSRDFVIGLPISSTMICACIAFITAGTWIDKYGWRKCHFRGVLFAGVGLFLSGIARTSTGFILYQGVIGFGYGLAFISYMAFVYAATNRRQQTIGFSVMSAGMFSGSICGGAVGGMLAERIEYSSVFFVGTALVGLALVFPSLFMRVNVRKKSKPPEKSTPRISATLLLRFCLNRNIFSLLLMLSIPSAVVFVGFLYYFSPVYLDRLGVSEADIARILMINGIGLIYLAPLISPIIDRSRSKKKFIVLSGLLSAFAIMIFSLIEGVVAVVISIAIISLAAAFGNSTRTVYALQQKAALDLGSGLSMSIYRAVDRIGWVLGPMVIGFILALGNIRLGLTIMGVVCLGFTLLFLIVSKEETR